MSSRKSKYVKWLFAKFSNKTTREELISNGDNQALATVIKERITELYNILDVVDEEHKYTCVRYFD